MIARERSLRKPLRGFLCLLARSELGASLATLPTALVLVLLGACLAQRFFLHSFTVLDSGVRGAMALDRFVAILPPPRYAAILTNARGAVLCVVLIAPLPLLLRGLPFQSSSRLAHPYCLQPNLIRLPCTDTAFSRQAGLLVLLCSFGSSLSALPWPTP